jgi:hypothetical protein
MPNTLTTSQLLSAQAMITNGNVLGFYDYMASQGYGYANLAKGVVECTLLSGGSTAQNFMTQEAARRGISMTEQQVHSVERVMAQGFIGTLIANSRVPGANGVVNQDVAYGEALAFHTSGFQSLSLPKELWTLYKPSEVLSQTQLQSNWSKTIDPAQSSGLNPAWNFSTGFGLDMGLAAQQALLTGNLGTFAKAAEWSAGVSLTQAASASSAAGITQASAGCNVVIADGVQQLQTNAATTLAHNPRTPPPDAPTRNSANYITDTSANDHLVVIKDGGKVWDAYVQQKDSTTGFKDWNEYQAAAAASNPGIANLNNVAPGTVFMQPEKFADGSITYNFAGDTAINSKASTGEYHMVVPNTDGGGGQTVYSRKLQGYTDVDGPVYEVKQSSTNAADITTFDYVGRQTTLNGDVQTATHHEYNPTTGALLETRSSYAGTDAYGESYALTNTTGQDGINHLSVSREDGSTTALDTNNASERNAAGLYSKEEISERLEQLGSAAARVEANDSSWRQAA